jgi:peptidoglycan/LPS O-acetylase OafA/YrhL
MATSPIPFVAQPHVRPILIAWSRWLAGGVTAIASSTILIAGFLAVADGVSHHFWLALLLLIGLFILVLVVWLPTLLPQAPETSRR